MMNLRDLCFRLQDDTLSMTWTSDRGRPWRHNIAADRFWVALRLVRQRLRDGEPLVLQELISALHELGQEYVPVVIADEFQLAAPLPDLVTVVQGVTTT